MFDQLMGGMEERDPVFILCFCWGGSCFSIRTSSLKELMK